MSIFIVVLIYYGIGSIFTLKQKYEVNKNLKIVLALLPMFILVGFRGINIGSDTWFYAHVFENIGSQDSLLKAIANSRYEIGFVVLNYIFAKVGFTYNMLQVTITFFICFSIGKFFKRYCVNVWIGSYVFYTLRYMLGPMNTVRMWIAIAILLFSIPYLQKQRPIQFFGIVVMASLFHSTALVFLVLYPLCKVRLTKRKIVLLYIIALVIGAMGTSFFAWLTKSINMYSGYLTSKYFVYDNNVAVFLNLAIDLCLVVFIFYEYRKELDEGIEKNTEINSLDNIIKVALLLIVAIDIVGLRNTIMNRISAYFGMFLVIAIPSAIKKINFKYNREIIWLGMGGLLALQFLVVMIFRPEWNSVVPYYFF